MTKKPQTSQILLVAALGGSVLMLLGMVTGMLIGKRQTSEGRQSAPVAASPRNESGLGVSRQRMIDLFASKNNGGFRFELTQGGLHDFYLGTSGEFDGVSLQMSGPPDELQQISVLFKLKNVGHRVQLQNVLKSIFKTFRTKLDLSRLMTWIDQSTRREAGTDVTVTTALGHHRFLLYAADDGSFVLRIEPAVVVTWRRD